VSARGDRVLLEQSLAKASALVVAFHAALHPVRFRRSGTGITAYCEPCGWRAHLEDDHSLTDLVRLTEQHSGIES
jgi:hypothetical protein